VVVICPSRELHFGDPTPVQEFVERRVVWIELPSERKPPSAPPLLRALGMLLLPEEQLPDCSRGIRAEVAGTSLDAEIDDLIAATWVSRFSGRTIPLICLRHGWDHRRRLHEQRGPTARSLGWATSKVIKRVSKKADKLKPLPSPSACLGIAAAP
jgi:hypothetical protein